MSNPFDGIISSQMKTQFKQAINEVIRGCEVNCRLFYPITSYSDCVECSSMISSASPNPFIGGNKGKLNTGCSYCGGEGKIPIESYDDLNLCVMFDYREYKDIVPGIVFTPGGDAKTFSKMETITVIKACKYIIFDTSIQHINKHIFTRSGEPVPCGFGSNDYIITTWRIGG